MLFSRMSKATFAVRGKYGSNWSSTTLLSHPTPSSADTCNSVSPCRSSMNSILSATCVPLTNSWVDHVVIMANDPQRAARAFALHCLKVLARVANTGTASTVRG